MQVYRHDDISHELTGSALARANMIARITGQPVQLHRMDAGNSVDRAHTNTRTENKIKRLINANRPTDDKSSAKAAKERYLQRVKANGRGN